MCPTFGSHMSIAGGYYRALERGADIGFQTIAVFSASPRIWKRGALTPDQISRFEETQKKTRINPVILHALYLANPASPRKNIRKKTISALLQEVEFCNSMSIRDIVIHPGHYLDSSLSQGIRHAARTMDSVIEQDSRGKFTFALETTAGGKSSIGSRFEHIRDIIGQSRYPERFTVCIDTCHVFAAGYDLRSSQALQSTLNEFDRMIGLNNLSVMHLNDSRKTLGSNIDRHTHIGEGMIGRNGFRNIINEPRLDPIPMILETPKDPHGDLDKKNLQCLLELQKT